MSKLRLTDVEWGVFFIGGNDGIFDITSTGSGIDKNKLNDTEGRVPYITRTDLQNGINLFVKWRFCSVSNHCKIWNQSHKPEHN